MSKNYGQPHLLMLLYLREITCKSSLFPVTSLMNPYAIVVIVVDPSPVIPCKLKSYTDNSQQPHAVVKPMVSIYYKISSQPSSVTSSGNPG